MKPGAYRHSAEARAKISAAKKGVKRAPFSAEWRANMSIIRKGKKRSPFSAETKANIGAASRGRRHTAETRAKIRAANIGNKNGLGYKHTAEARIKMSIFHRGKPSHFKGHKCSTETIAKMSAARLGPKNPRWMGGISRSPYAWTFNEELKEEVRRRDDYQCQLCGASQVESDKTLGVHHIDYGKKNSDPVNLVALCHSCHSRTNTNRKHWTALFQARAIRLGITKLEEK